MATAKRRRDSSGSDDPSGANSDGDSDGGAAADADAAADDVDDNVDLIDVDAADEDEGDTAEAPCEAVAPPEPRAFASWQAFDEYFREYQRRTFQCFRIQSRITVENNRRRLEGRDRRTSIRLPEPESGWVDYSRRYECTHAGTGRRRGTGKRQRRDIRGTDCPAKLSVFVRPWVRDARVGPEGFRVKFGQIRLQHNHPISREIAASYARLRVPTDVSVLEQVQALAAGGAKPGEIVRRLREQQPPGAPPTVMVTRRDIVNMLARLSHTSPTTSQQLTGRVLQWLKVFNQTPGNASRLVHHDKELAAVVFQTQAMHAAVAHFTDVLVINISQEDTHRLCGFFVLDGFGTAHVVQLALLQRADLRESLEGVIHQFKCTSPESWDAIRAVIVQPLCRDVAPTLQTAFPKAKIWMWQPEVLSHLEDWAKSFFGSTLVERALTTIRNMIFAATKENYQESLEALTTVIANEETTDEGEHLTTEEALDVVRKWDVCHELWASCARDNAVIVGEIGTRSLAHCWRQLMDLVAEHETIDDRILALLRADANGRAYGSERCDALPACIASSRLHPAELIDLIAFVTPYGIELMYPEFELSLPTMFIVIRNTPAIISVQHKAPPPPVPSSREPSPSAMSAVVGKPFEVARDRWTCNCSFMRTLQLPCRHVFVARKILNFESVMPPPRFLNKRWLRICASPTPRATTDKRCPDECDAAPGAT